MHDDINLRRLHRNCPIPKNMHALLKSKTLRLSKLLGKVLSVNFAGLTYQMSLILAIRSSSATAH